MTALARAFVAVYPPPEVLDAVARRVAVARRSAPELRWSPPEQWHVTVRFLGRVHDAEGLVARLAGAIAGVAPADVRLEQVGAFPTPRRASVLWLGVEGGSAMSPLARSVEVVCVRAGFAPEVRPFHPHLTVARAPRPVDLRGLIEELGPDPVGGRWPTADVRLVASDTRPEGPVHEVVARLPLGDHA